MADRLEIVSAERIRDELDKLIVAPHPSAGLWFCVDTGLADQFLPELPAMRLEQDPIHRHKDVLTHTLAVVENVRPPAEWRRSRPFDFRRTRLAALFHDVGKPRTRGYQQGKGVTFHHHDAVGARMTRKRLTALRYSNDDIEAITELVALHLRFHTYQMGWTDSAVRRYVRDAGPLLARAERAHPLRLHDAQRAQGAGAVAADGRAGGARSPSCARAGGAGRAPPRARRRRVMELLGVPPGPVVGEALAFLLEIRLDEGLLGEDGDHRAPRRVVGRAERVGRRRAARGQTPLLRARSRRTSGASASGWASSDSSSTASTRKFARPSCMNSSPNGGVSPAP